MKSNDWLLKYLVIYIIAFGAIFIPTAYLISHNSGKAVHIRKSSEIMITDVIMCDIERESKTILLNKVLTNQELYDISKDKNHLVWKSDFVEIVVNWFITVLSLLFAVIILIVIIIIIYGVYLLFKN